jgi:polyisoprenoid-binding protein YceI
MKKQTWELAPKHSTIQFKVKYLQISNVTGYFHKFSGTIATDEFFRAPEVSILIEADSIETYSDKWNARLRSEDFFATELYPQISFLSSDECRKSSGQIWEITGQLTIKKTSRPVTLLINFSDIKEDRKRPTALFHLYGTISRRDFGFDKMDEKEIGDEILLNAEVFLLRKP